ncbi:MAG: methionyl-tRNA formyltransferase [Leptospirales bacterium]
MTETPVKISYWGSPGISAALLKVLIDDSRFQIEFVVSQPDKPRSGRGREVIPTPVKAVALENSIPVYTPVALKKNTETILSDWNSYKPAVHVVFAYGKIIPEALFSSPALGSVNFHASLLPLLRGASPIEHSLWHGFSKTGWTLQQVANRLDTGNILAQTIIDIEPADSTSTVAQKLFDQLEKWSPEALLDYVAGKLTPIEQQEDMATHCGKIYPEMGKIEWSKTSTEINNMARALQERPGVFSYWNKTRIKIFFDFQTAALQPENSEVLPPGSISDISDNGIFITCADGLSLKVLYIQPDGKKRLSAKDFVNGYRVKLGDLFTSGIE